MNAIAREHSALIAETDIEISGHAFLGYPTIDELAAVVGHDYRTIKNAASLMWIWDDLGVAALSWTCRFDRPDPDQHKVSLIWFVIQTVAGDENRPRQTFPGKITVFGESWLPRDNPHDFVKAILISSQHLGIRPRQDVPATWGGVNHCTQILWSGGRVFLLDPSTDPTVSPNSPHEVSITYSFPRLDQETVHSDKTKTQLTQLILKHLEREGPAGTRLIIRSQIRILPVCLIVIAFGIYLGFASIRFTHSVWLSVLLAYVVGGGLFWLTDKFVLSSKSLHDDFDINLRDASIRITADILQSFPYRKPGHIQLDFLPLWNARAFYPVLPWFKAFYASQYANLLVSAVYSQLGERVPGSLKSASTLSGGTAGELPVRTEAESVKPESSHPASAPPDSNTCRCCGHPVSPRAAECPTCGEPFGGRFFRVNRVTNEQTSKAEKVTAVLARLILFFAIVALPFDLVFYGGAHVLVLVFLIVASGCLRLLLRVGSWWHHE